MRCTYTKEYSKEHQACALIMQSTHRPLLMAWLMISFIFLCNSVGAYAQTQRSNKNSVSQPVNSKNSNGRLSSLRQSYNNFSTTMMPAQNYSAAPPSYDSTMMNSASPVYSNNISQNYNAAPPTSQRAGRPIEGPAENHDSALIMGLQRVGQVHEDVGDVFHIPDSPVLRDEDPISEKTQRHRDRVAASALKRKNNPNNAIQALGNTVKAGFSAGNHVVDAGINAALAGKAITQGGMNVTDNVMDIVDVGTSTAAQLVRDASNLSFQDGFHNLKKGGSYIAGDVLDSGKEVFRGGKKILRQGYRVSGDVLGAGRDIVEDPTLNKVAKGIVRAVANDVTAGGYSVLEGAVGGLKGEKMLTDAISLGMEALHNIKQRVMMRESVTSQSTIPIPVDQNFYNNGGNVGALPVYNNSPQISYSDQPVYEQAPIYPSLQTPTYQPQDPMYQQQPVIYPSAYEYPQPGYAQQQPIAAY